MENIYQSKYQKIQFDTETAIIHNTWLSDSFMMTAEDYKSELTKLVQLIEQHSATRQLIDTLQFQFTIDIDLQTWTDEEVNRRSREIGVQKVAFVIAKEIFSQMSIEQTMDGAEGKEMEVQYFTSEEDARQWLIK